MSLSSFKNEFSELKENIAKGTTDPRVEFCLPKFKQVLTEIKYHLQNLNQALNISISTKGSTKKTVFLGVIPK